MVAAHEGADSPAGEKALKEYGLRADTSRMTVTTTRANERSRLMRGSSLAGPIPASLERLLAQIDPWNGQLDGHVWRIEANRDACTYHLLRDGSQLLVSYDPALLHLFLAMGGLNDHLCFQPITALGRFVAHVESPSDRITLQACSDRGWPLIAMYCYTRVCLRMDVPAIRAEDGSDEISLAEGDSILLGCVEGSAGVQLNRARRQALQMPPGGQCEVHLSIPDGVPEVPDLDAMLGELGELIGLDSAKAAIRRYAAYAYVARLRRDAGILVTSPALSLAFVGNPGTGKTTVARIIAKLLHQFDLVKSDKLVEAQYSDLVGQYVGHTEAKTRALLESARGGVLFIDEAYSLNQSTSGNDFGRKALTEIVAAMENYRDELVIIFAGYPRETLAMIESNPGLKSRLADIVEFDDYDADELALIAERIAAQTSYELTGGAGEKIREIARQMLAARQEHFGNGREMRRLIEAASMRQAERLVDHARHSLSIPDATLLRRLEADDLVYSPLREGKNRLGFAV
jgi:stage V sporulation protein K